MSGINTLVEFMQAELLPMYDAEAEAFAPHIQEEYLMHNGWIDKEYISAKAKVNLSTDSFRKAVKQVFGVASFDLLITSSDITQRSFSEVYEFGKFHNMRSWIGYVYATTGKLICRCDIYDFVLRS